MRMRTAIYLVVLGSFFGFSRAGADAPCIKGFRDTTPAERATMTTVLESARAAVPEPPAGWVKTLHDDSVSALSGICLDFFPWTYSYSRNYTRVEGAEERDQAIRAEGEKLRAAAAARQPQLDAYQARLTELSTEYAEAATSGDDARFQAVTTEMAALQAEYERFVSEDDSLSAFEAATAAQYLDLEMSVHVMVNPARETPDQGAQAIEVPGAASASQWLSDGERETATALVLFGEWLPSPSGFGLEPVTHSGAAPEQVHAISVRFHAHKDRIASLIEATDFVAIAALRAH